MKVAGALLALAAHAFGEEAAEEYELSGPSAPTANEMASMIKCDPGDWESAGPNCAFEKVFVDTRVYKSCDEYAESCADTGGFMCEMTAEKYDVRDFPNRDDKLSYPKADESCPGANECSVSKGCDRGFMVACECDPAKTKTLKYSGCHKDSTKRVLPYLKERNNMMNPIGCSAHCQDFPMFGVEDTNECWCGEDNDVLRASRLDASREGECNRDCRTGSGKITNADVSSNSGVPQWNNKCGGAWRISVFTHTNECKSIAFEETSDGSAKCTVVSSAMSGSGTKSGLKATCSDKAAATFAQTQQKQRVVDGTETSDGTPSIAVCMDGYVPTGCGCTGTECNTNNLNVLRHSSGVSQDSACVATRNAGKTSGTIRAQALCTPVGAMSMVTTMEAIPLCLSPGCAKDTESATQNLVARARFSGMLAREQNQFIKSITSIECPVTEVNENTESKMEGQLVAGSEILVVSVFWLLIALIVFGTSFVYCPDMFGR